jgi:hypothetical protein
LESFLAGLGQNQMYRACCYAKTALHFIMQSRHTPYRSALPSLDSIFAGYTGSKNQVQNRQKIKFIKLYLQKIDISKIKFS